MKYKFMHNKYLCGNCGHDKQSAGHFEGNVYIICLECGDVLRLEAGEMGILAVTEKGAKGE